MPKSQSQFLTYHLILCLALCLIAAPLGYAAMAVGLGAGLAVTAMNWVLDNWE